MKRRHLTTLALAALVLVTLVYMQGCAHKITDYPAQPRMTAQADPSIQDVLLTVRWRDSVDDLQCGTKPRSLIYGCRAEFAKVGNLAKCVLEMVKPDDFNDRPKLLIVGHEVFHCFDALHE